MPFRVHDPTAVLIAQHATLREVGNRSGVAEDVDPGARSFRGAGSGDPADVACEDDDALRFPPEITQERYNFVEEFHPGKTSTHEKIELAIACDDMQQLSLLPKLQRGKCARTPKKEKSYNVLRDLDTAS